MWIKSTSLPMQKSEVVEFFNILRDQNPDPKGELEYTNSFTLLVAVALSAQATDKGVNKATSKLFAVADTPQKMLDLGEEGLRDYIRTIGLFNSKARNIIALSRILVDKFDGKVPANMQDLESLPGVGRKTANVVLSIAFHQPAIAVDTHVFRVSNRTGMACGKTPIEVEKKLLEIIPEEFLLHAHHWLILHGRYTCIARKPRCHECPVSHLCLWFREHQNQE